MSREDALRFVEAFAVAASAAQQLSEQWSTLSRVPKPGPLLFRDLRTFQYYRGSQVKTLNMPAFEEDAFSSGSDDELEDLDESEDLEGDALAPAAQQDQVRCSHQT